MICNNPACSRLGTDGEELRSNFLVTACGHAFCSDCTKLACREALCLFCKCELTDETTNICNPEEEQQLAVCGLEPAQIMSITSRALQFYVNQIQLRCQMESDRVEQVESKNAKLKQAMKELLSNQVSAVNILKSRASALEKELEVEKRRAASSQKKLLEEMRQKRRLEDEAQQRRWQRSTFASFSTSSPKRMKGASSGQHQITNSALVGRQREGGVDEGGGAMLQLDVQAIKPNSAPPHQMQSRFQEMRAEDERAERHPQVDLNKREQGSMQFNFQDPNMRFPSNSTMRPSTYNDARMRSPPRR